MGINNINYFRRQTAGYLLELLSDNERDINYHNRMIRDDMGAIKCIKKNNEKIKQALRERNIKVDDDE